MILKITWRNVEMRDNKDEFQIRDYHFYFNSATEMIDIFRIEPLNKVIYVVSSEKFSCNRNISRQDFKLQCNNYFLNIVNSEIFDGCKLEVDWNYSYRIDNFYLEA